MNKNLLFVVLILTIGLFLVGCEAPADDGTRTGSTGTGSINTQINDDLPAEEKIEQQQNKIIVEYSASTKKILGKNEFVSDEAKSGMTYLILDMTITNQGYEEFSTNPFYWNVIVDNVKYDIAFVMNLDNELGTRTIMNNGKISGNIAFEVPESVDTFEIVYEAFQTYNIEYIQK